MVALPPGSKEREKKVKPSHISNWSYRKMTKKEEKGVKKGRKMHSAEQREARESELHKAMCTGKKHVMIF